MTSPRAIEHRLSLLPSVFRTLRRQPHGVEESEGAKEKSSNFQKVEDLRPNDAALRDFLKMIVTALLSSERIGQICTTWRISSPSARCICTSRHLEHGFPKSRFAVHGLWPRRLASVRKSHERPPRIIEIGRFGESGTKRMNSEESVS